MFKLLTDEGKEKVSREYATRRAIVMLISLIVVMVIGIVGLFPSYVVSKVRQEEMEERAKIVRNFELEEENEALRAWLVTANQKIKTLNPELDKDRPSLLVESVLEKSPAGLSITNILWSKEGNKVSVSGAADNRQALLSFKDRLDSSGEFSLVDLPISSLASDSDISFEINLSPRAP